MRNSNRLIHCIILILSTFFVVSSAYGKEYTLQNRYKKLIKDYPQIQLPSQTIPREILSYQDVVYKKVTDHVLAMSIYRPKNSTASFPLVVMIHGGGWQSGTPELLKTLAFSIAAQGFVVAVPAYRLSTEAQYPAAINDLATALNWLTTHKAQYNIDTSKLALIGSSAGGQMAALLAYSQGQLKETNNPLIKANVLINIDGLSDFTTPIALRYENDPSKKITSASAWLGSRYEDNPQRWHNASPINYINASSPATLFINSSAKRFYAGREKAIQKLNFLGITTEVYQFKDAPHCFWLFQPWQTDTIKAMTLFLKKQL